MIHFSSQASYVCYNTTSSVKYVSLIWFISQISQVGYNTIYSVKDIASVGSFYKHIKCIIAQGPKHKFTALFTFVQKQLKFVARREDEHIGS